MASSKQLLLLAVVAAVASLASATTIMVGDAQGWRAAFNQTGWADGKKFLVGDSLMFMYDNKKHTVAQVNEEDFAACNLQGKFILGPLTTGNDVVKLDKSGKAWFICTAPGHCNGGMKLVVDVIVLDSTTTTPASPPLPFPWPFPYPFPMPGAPAPAPFPFFRPSFPFPLPGVPAPAPSPSGSQYFPFPHPGVPAPAPSPWFGSSSSPYKLPGAPALAPASSPSYRLWRGSAPAPASVAAPPSAAVRNPVGGAVAAAAAAVVVAVLAF